MITKGKIQGAKETHGKKFHKGRGESVAREKDVSAK